MKTLKIKHGSANDKSRVKIYRGDVKREYFPTWESIYRLNRLVRNSKNSMTVISSSVIVIIVWF